MGSFLGKREGYYRIDLVIEEEEVGEPHGGAEVIEYVAETVAQLYKKTSKYVQCTQEVNEYITRKRHIVH